MTQDLEAKLQNETVKWLQRAEQIFTKITPKEEPFAKNIQAYLFDSHYFLEKGDLVRAFEAVIWAWAWMEIGQEMGLIGKDE